MNNAKDKKETKKLKKKQKAINWPKRTCYSLHECFFCEKQITLGQEYYDGGYGNRIHIKCAMEE